MGNATKKSIFDHSFPEKRLLHCQLLSEPKNLQSLFIFLGYVSLERVFFYLGPKILSTKRATFQICPRKRPSETILFGVGLMGKYMCMCTEEEKGARIRWRISEAGECTSELRDLTSEDCAQLVLVGSRSRQLFFP